MRIAAVLPAVMVVIILLSSLYIVRDHGQVIIMQFGKLPEAYGP
jgi:regulator of protease activity HflC (stomatin/prohibitin superfamily)